MLNASWRGSPGMSRRRSPIADVKLEGDKLCGLDLARFRHLGSPDKYRYAATLGSRLPLSAVIAAYLYLRITVSMYMSDDEAEEEAAPDRGRRLPIPFGAGLALAVSFAVTLFVGFLPGSLADTSADAVPVSAAQK